MALTLWRRHPIDEALACCRGLSRLVERERLWTGISSRQRARVLEEDRQEGPLFDMLPDN